MELKPEIFVSIASYRDAELIPTLTDMIKNASGLYSLNIAVCWQDEGNITPFLNAGMELSEQRKQGEHDLYIFNYQGTRLQFLSVHYFLSEGACWARHLCESLFNNEDYFLQIDSHCRFIESWDKEMVAMLTELQKQSNHPVISSYPPGYKPDDEESKNDYVSRLVFRSFSGDRILQLNSVNFTADEPFRGTYLAGGFIFARGEFVIDIPNDPHIFFEGEEIAMAARAFTHGYDVWHPHKILLWHFYGRKDHTKVWSDHNGEAKEAGSIDKAWWDRDRESKKRVRYLFGSEEEGVDIEPRYALGERRTLKEFEDTIGVDFTLCSVLPEVIEKERCSYFTDNHLQDWRKRIISANRRTLIFSKSELDCPLDTVSRLHIGVYSHANDLLEKKVVSGAEIEKSINDENSEELKFELNFTTLSSLKPSVIRVSPYIHDEGWGKIVERAW